MGVSLGGYLAARAAAFEPRLAALIADDGLYDVFAATMAMAPQAHDLLAVLDLPQALEFDALIEKMKAHATTTTRWALSHGPRAFAVKTPREYMAKLRAYSLVGLAERIACPTLVMEAENDLFFRGQPEQLYAALTCPKTFIRFTAEEGADEHCHCGAARLTNQRVFDWLDGVFKR
jgi:pimeloyl-ACP methyl ester carboxylesterase